jgi:hypothetical protein
VIAPFISTSLADKFGEGEFRNVSAAERLSAMLIGHVMSQDSLGRTPLHLAAESGNKDVPEILLRWGATVWTKDHRGRDPLHLAAKNGHYDIVARLIEPDETRYGDHGFTALHLAAENNHAAVTKLIAEREPSLVDPPCAHGHTALYYTIKSCSEEVVNILPEHNASVKTVGRNNMTALHAAARFNAPIALVSALVAAPGADVNAADFHHATPLHEAARAGHPEVLSLLLQFAADVVRTTKLGSNALHCAASGGHKILGKGRRSKNPRKKPPRPDCAASCGFQWALLVFKGVDKGE